jgi:hypothetical protein
MAKFTETPILSNRFSHAVNLALLWHRNQVRKQGVPYVSHLLQVSGLVIEHGGSEDEAIAAVLHDAVEDVDIPIEHIRELFGEKVAKIVNAVSEDKALPREQRKAAYVLSIGNSDRSVGLVSAADKLHNLRCYANQPELLDEGVCLFYCRLIPEYAAVLNETTASYDFRVEEEHPMVAEMKAILLAKILPVVSNQWVVGDADWNEDSFMYGEARVVKSVDLKLWDIGYIRAITATSVIA